SGNAFSLVPGRGSCLLDVRFKGISVLDAYETAEEVDFNRWAKNMPLFPFPNRLKEGRFSWKGKTYQFPVNDPQTGNALHGFGMDCEMVIDKVTVEANQATAITSFHYRGEKDHYPFPFEVFFSFRMRNPHDFEIKSSFVNRGKSNMPLGFGWHPYFRLSEEVGELSLKLPPLRWIGVDADMIPTGKRYDYDAFLDKKPIGTEALDNCFAIPENTGMRTEVLLEGAGGQLKYWQENGGDKYNFIQLFTPPYRSSLAIEPMSCNIDAFNNGEGLIDLSPGEEASARFGFSFTPDR
ncbi:MAG: aldose 1-epimerase, partial [Saprospiraceae bacterium]|nr:aldose 1-epimerase [Saprospiraceae bacterium]